MDALAEIGSKRAVPRLIEMLDTERVAIETLCVQAGQAEQDARGARGDSRQ